LAAESAYELGLIRIAERRHAEAVAALTLALGGTISLHSRSDALLLRSYANLAQGRVELSRTDFSAYEALEAEGPDTEGRRKLSEQLRTALR
jgi:hypothetical protein